MHKTVIVINHNIAGRFRFHNILTTEILWLHKCYVSIYRQLDISGLIDPLRDQGWGWHLLWNLQCHSNMWHSQDYYKQGQLTFSMKILARSHKMTLNMRGISHKNLQQNLSMEWSTTRSMENQKIFLLTGIPSNDKPIFSVTNFTQTEAPPGSNTFFCVGGHVLADVYDMTYQTHVRIFQ